MAGGGGIKWKFDLGKLGEAAAKRGPKKLSVVDQFEKTFYAAT
jgi:hypothetical protein